VWALAAVVLAAAILTEQAAHELVTAGVDHR